MKNKDLAFLEFRKINERSWTYNRLTEAEKKAWSDTLASTAGTIKGTGGLENEKGNHYKV